MKKKLILTACGLIFVVIGAFFVLVGRFEYHFVSLNKAQLKQVTKMAQNGNGAACFCLSLYYSEREEESERWLQRAADLGDPNAQYRVHDRLISKDPRKALQLLEMAAGKGQISALEALGKVYRDGGLVNRDARRAEFYFRKAALKGSKFSMLDLSSLLTKTYRDRDRLTEAYTWLLMASWRSNPNTPFASETVKQELAISDKISREGYRVARIKKEAEEQAIRQNKSIPRSAIAPDYDGLCQDLAEKGN